MHPLSPVLLRLIQIERSVQLIGKKKGAFALFNCKTSWAERPPAS